MGKAKQRKKLVKLDKPFTISKEILNTSLGQSIVWLMNEVEPPFPNPIQPFHIAIFQQFQSEFILELMWVLKDSFPAIWRRIDYPFNTTVCRALESRGLESLRLLNLSMQCEEFDPNFTCSLVNWMFAKAEHKVSTLRKYFSQGTNKQANIESNSDMIRELKVWENPYRSEIDPSLPKKNCFYRYNLFKTAIVLGKPLSGDSRDKYAERKAFQDKAWTPYINALSAINRDERDGVENVGFYGFDLKGDSIVAQLKGRQTEPWFSPPKKNISGRGRKPNQNLNNPYPVKDTASLNQILTVL